MEPFPAMPEISHARYRAGEGEPLVLVHGFTATWRCWLPVIAELVPRFEVIAPTLHGHDGGPEPDAGDHAHTLAHAADHFERLLDEQGIEDAHFAGNSMGGALALEMAKRGRARSVVAISPGGGWEPTDRAEVERIIKFFARTRALSQRTDPYLPRIMSRPGARRLSLRDVMARGDLVPPAEAVKLVRSSLRCTVVDDVFTALREGNGHISDLDRIDCPVLVTWGDRDRILPMDWFAPRLRDEIPGVDFRVLPGLGHTPMWDDPTLCAATIAGIVTGVADRTPAPTPTEEKAAA
jgi:pimeloyl-ACP methyl ester carboxylesterase